MTESKLIAEGKTKRIWTAPNIIRTESKNDITAGDGAKHDIFAGKAAFSTTVNDNVMRVLQAHGIPVAYICRCPGSATDFYAENCTMYLYEVVVRGVALGSYLKRNIRAVSGSVFDPPLVEFYLKTSGNNFKGIPLEKDDPLIVEITPRGLKVVRPDIPTSEASQVFISRKELGWKLDGYDTDPFDEMGQIAVDVFKLLRDAWARLHYTLADFKVEFGRTQSGKLVVADVIDNDSWRLLDQDGKHLDKQLYRDGKSLEIVEQAFRQTADLTELLVP